MLKLALVGLVFFGFTVKAASLYVASSEVPIPVQIVESQTEILMEQLSSRKDEFDKDPQALIYFARHVALSHWDLQKASRLMLGKHWKKADSKQRERFEEEFLRTLLRYVVRAYGFYDDSFVEILSYDWHPKSKGGWVHSVIQLPAGLKVSVDYRMNLDRQKQWKLIDVRVEGISLVSSKRTEYRQMVSKEGLEALLKIMYKKNKKVLQS
ncbi:MAG: ABC transporter substrate-binding protein [Gammaproteobacteria bacterium]|nr:ABC transporter substrate-binding protein [Gammaproteobacteria bacterium]